MGFLFAPFGKKFLPSIDVSKEAKEDPIKWPLIEVAVNIENVVYGYNVPHKTDLDSLTYYAWYHSGLFFYGVRMVVFLHMFLGFLERPFASSRDELVPIPATLIIEIGCILVYIFELLYKTRFQELLVIASDRKNIAQVIVIVLTIIDIVIFIGTASADVDYPRWSRLLRPYFFIYNVRSVRVAFRDIRNSLPQVGLVLILIFGLVIFYTQFCVIFYLNSSEGDQFFSDIFDGFFNLYVLLTTANFPDVMIPAYTQNRYNALIFISFLVLGLYLLLNFVLAIIYSGYRQHLREEVNTAILNERIYLRHAFDELTSTSSKKEIDLPRWKQLFSVLRPSYDEEKVELLFKLADDTQTNTLNTYREFANILTVLNWKIEKQPEESNIWESCCPSIYKTAPFQWLRKYVVLHPSGWFGYLIDVVIFTNAVVTLAQLQITATSEDQNFSNDRSSEWVFFSIYLVELILKVAACGPLGYWKHDWNKFDLFVLVGTLVDLLASVSGSDVEELRIFLVLRMLRLARLTGHIPQFKLLTKTMFSLIPIVISYTGVVLCLYYFFAILGMEIWGGEIRRDNPELQDPTIPFVAAGYFPNNFNTFGEALILLFQLTVVNNWQVNVSGFVAVSSRAAWIYFIVFHVFAVLIIFNVLVGIVIENFQIQYDEEVSPPDDVELRIEETLKSSAWKGHVKRRITIGNLIKRQIQSSVEIVDLANDEKSVKLVRNTIISLDKKKKKAQDENEIPLEESSAQILSEQPTQTPSEQPKTDEE